MNTTSWHDLHHVSTPFFNTWQKDWKTWNFVDGDAYQIPLEDFPFYQYIDYVRVWKETTEPQPTEPSKFTYLREFIEFEKLTSEDLTIDNNEFPIMLFRLVYVMLYIDSSTI